MDKKTVIDIAQGLNIDVSGISKPDIMEKILVVQGTVKVDAAVPVSDNPSVDQQSGIDTDMAMANRTVMLLLRHYRIHNKGILRSSNNNNNFILFLGERV